jgi:hypothetical protein
MKLIEAKAVVEYKAPQQGAFMMFVPEVRVMLHQSCFSENFDANFATSF